jgi:hypothetical protein
MKSQTQINWVRSVLETKGRITRNKCIREQFITRLSAIIHTLRHEEGMNIVGSKFKTKYGEDYQYELVK